MPRKVRDLLKDLQNAVLILCVVEWSEEDRVYIGRCPDLLTGIHGEDPVQLYAELCDVIEEVIEHFTSESRPLPTPRVRPMMAIA